MHGGAYIYIYIFTCTVIACGNANLNVIEYKLVGSYTQIPRIVLTKLIKAREIKLTNRALLCRNLSEDAHIHCTPYREGDGCSYRHTPFTHTSNRS